MADAGLDQTVPVNTTVQLDATGSIHPDGTIESYEWRIETPNDRTLMPACTACAQTSFKPTTPGKYEATVTVTDAAGNTSTDTLYITVEDAGPKIDLTGNPAPETGDRVTYFADVVADGAPLDEIVWRVDGENATIRSLDGRSAESSVSMVFLKTDAARVQATVYDEAGRTDSAVLNVEPYADNPSETSTVAGPEPAQTEATCNDGEYFAENHAECLGQSGSKAPLEVDLPSTIDLCRGDETRLEPTVETPHEQSLRRVVERTDAIRGRRDRASQYHLHRYC
ncbi:PKD domain-containing protein [Natronomonas amylolytica]|uniref:PKD domain-containing protein n=1 Tax=Natronomonas amylolytica TaxID=3108498 RepID=UPI00300B22D2